MKVSIIVPVYNVETYLSKCVESLLNQTSTDIEIILVDDGSTDGSPAICDFYSTKYNNIHTYHKVNGGLSSARNYGVEKAIGDWIIFVDSDDYWVSSEVLSTLLHVACKNNADVVRFEYSAVDESGEALYEHSYEKKRSIIGRPITSYELFHWGISGEYFTCLFLLRRSLVSDLRFDESRKFQEDIDFGLRLFATKQFNCAYCEKRFYAYRKRRNSITTTPALSNLVASFTLADQFYYYADIASDRDLQQEYRYNAVMMYYWTLCTFVEKPYFDIRRGAFKALRVNSFRKKAIVRMFKHRVFSKASLLICLPQGWSVILIYLRNWLLLKRKEI